MVTRCTWRSQENVANVTERSETDAIGSLFLWKFQRWEEK